MRRGAVMVCPCSLAEMLSVSQSAVHVRDSIRRAVLEHDRIVCYDVTFTSSDFIFGSFHAYGFTDKCDL